VTLHLIKINGEDEEQECKMDNSYFNSNSCHTTSFSRKEQQQQSGGYFALHKSITTNMERPEMGQT